MLAVDQTVSVQMTFYGCYHTKHGNQAIHFVFVPAILWSLAVWLAYPGPIAGLDLPSHLESLPEPVAQYALTPTLPASVATSLSQSI